MFNNFRGKQYQLCLKNSCFYFNMKPHFLLHPINTLLIKCEYIYKVKLIEKYNTINMLNIETTCTHILLTKSIKDTCTNLKPSHTILVGDSSISLRTRRQQ